MISMNIVTYVDDNGNSHTIAFDTLRFYKSGKRKGKIFSRNLYTLVGIRYGAQTVMRSNLTYCELFKYMNKLKNVY